MKIMKKRRKVTLILLLAVIALAGALLYIRTLDRGELEESPESAPLTREEVSDPEGDAKIQDMKAETESEEEDVDLRVKVGASEFPLIFEDGDYENLDKANLIWTVNNLFESVYDFKFSESFSSRRYHINGREVETNLYIHNLGEGHSPKIKSSSHKVIDYHDIIEKNGVHHLVLPREFIETFIEASSKYAEVTDELNNFIDRLNRINSAEIDNMTEVEIDSMFYFDPKFVDEVDEAGLELKKLYLREFTEDKHYQSTNVFWIEKGTEKDLYLDGDEAKYAFGGNAIIYKRKDKLSSWLRDDKANLELPPPSNFDPRLHTEPDAEPFVWVPADTGGFFRVDRQWKIAIFMPGT